MVNSESMGELFGPETSPETPQPTPRVKKGPKTVRTVNAAMPRTKALTQAALARELGISPPAVVKLKAQGMPCHDADAARAWRAANLQAGRVRPDPGPSPATLLKRVHDLAELAQRALGINRLDTMADELRLALHAVPKDHRPGVVLSFDLWRALIGPHACAVLDHGAAMYPEGEGGTQAPDDNDGAAQEGDDEATEVGDVVYALACGEAFVR